MECSPDLAQPVAHMRRSNSTRGAGALRGGFVVNACSIDRCEVDRVKTGGEVDFALGYGRQLGARQRTCDRGVRGLRRSEVGRIFSSRPAAKPER